MSSLKSAEIERLTREAAQAVVAAGQRAPLKGDVVEHLAERDRHHGEIDAAPPHDQGAEDGAAEAAQQHSQHQRQRRARRQEFQRQSGAIGAEAEIGGVTERQHAGKSKQEIQRHRRQPEHQHAGGERGIAAERHHPVGGEQQRCPDRRQRRSACGFARRSTHHSFFAEQSARPHQQHHRHQDVDHRLAGGREETPPSIPRPPRSAGRRPAFPAGCRCRRR